MEDGMKRLALLLLAITLLIPGARGEETLSWKGTAFPVSAEYLELTDEHIGIGELIGFLRQFPELKKVDMFGTPVTGSQIEELTAALPGITFGWTMMIPCSNPDGRLLVLSGYDTKNNGNGVNLNRNFPTNWVYDSSGLYGPSAGSEPETQAILEVLGRYPFELVLDCHTSGNVIYYADYDCSSELRNRSYSIATALSQESGYRLYLYEASAGMANYARHPYGVPGLTIEMYPYTSGVIDCTRFSEWVWPKLDTMPAIAMSYLK